MEDPKENKMKEEISYKIKYSDLTLGEHRIDLNEFAKSLQGFANSLAIIGTYITHNKITNKSSEFTVRIETEAEIKQGSIEITVFIASLLQAVGSISDLKTVFDLFTDYIFSKRGEDKMNEILDYIKSRDERDSQERIKLAELQHESYIKTLEVLQKTIDGPCKNSVGLIGNSCNQIDILDNQNQNRVVASIDKETRKSLMQKKKEQPEIIEKQMNVVFTEINLLNQTCKFCDAEIYENSEDEESLVTYSAKINDPDIDIPNNRYTAAFNEQIPLNVEIKEQRTAENSKIFIMGIAK